MPVKVVIERHVKHGYEERVIALLKELRAHCLDQSGYVSGETLRESSDPNRLLVISQWQGVGDWRQWEANTDRTALDEQIGPLLQEPTTIRVYLEGMSEETSGA